MNTRKCLFYEEQRFRQWWIWLIAFVPFLMSVSGWSYQLISGRPFGNNPAGNDEYVWIILSTLLVPLMFWATNLKTWIYDEGIYYRYTPFHFKKKFIPIDGIWQMYVREYSPLKEYGGWGIRYGLSGKCYNISGRMGLQIKLKNGKKLLIGTQRPAELKNIVDKLL